MFHEDKNAFNMSVRLQEHKHTTHYGEKRWTVNLFTRKLHKVHFSLAVHTVICMLQSRNQPLLDEILYLEP